MTTSRTDAPELGRGAGASTPQRILLAAERLFAERGVDGVSLREITSAAGVNSAAAHYHFGSKEGVLQELFAMRARPIADAREELLRAVRLGADGRPNLEDVLAAFLRPAFDGLGTPEAAAFSTLRARLSFENEAVRREVLGKAFDHTSGLTLRAIERALPDTQPKILHWRFQFLLGSMIYTMAIPGRLESITGGRIDTSDGRAALAQLVRYAAAGLRAT